MSGKAREPSSPQTPPPSGASRPPRPTHTQGDLNRDSWWTAVDIVEPEDTTDDDCSLVEISRASSPFRVEFNSLEIDSDSGVRINWPTQLPWFQFQDQYFNSTFVQNVILRGSTRERAADKRSTMLPAMQLQNLTTPQAVSRVASEVSLFMPEKGKGDNLAMVRSIASPDPAEAKQGEIQLFVYRLSNNLIEDENGEYFEEDGKYTKIIDIFRGIGLPLAVWKEHFVRISDQPTGRAFIDNLFEAALNTRSLDLCEALLETGADPDKIFYSWTTGYLERPVQMSVDSRVRSLALLTLLIRFGADVDLVTEDNYQRALHIAARNCTVEEVRAIVEAGADIHAPVARSDGRRFESALTCAAQADNWICHSRGGQVEDAKEIVKRDSHEILRYLLPLYDRNIDHSLIQGALVIASEMARDDMVTILVPAGADVNERLPEGYTPLAASVAKRYKDFANCVSTATTLLDFGADVDAPAWSSSSIRPIHIAAARGREGLVRLLIERGADVNAIAYPSYKLRGTIPGSALEEGGQNTPLSLALYRNKGSDRSEFREKGPHAALVLVRAGVLLRGGEFCRASRFDSVELLRGLVARGADVQEVDSRNRTAVHNCLEFGNFSLLPYLLEEAGTKLIGNEFLCAVRAGSREAVDILVAHGAELLLPESGWDSSLLEAAALSKNWDLMKWLVDERRCPYDPKAVCAAVCFKLGEDEDRGVTYLAALLRNRPPDRPMCLFEATAVGFAAFRGQFEILDTLLKLGVPDKCIFPLPGLDRAAYLIFMGSRQYLEWSYVRDFWKDDNTSIQCSVLVPAIMGQDWETADILLRAGCRPDPLSLLAALEVGHIPDYLKNEWDDERTDEVMRDSLGMVRRLTRRMPLEDINAPISKYMHTPLQVAAIFKRLDIVRHLLSLGVDVNAPPVASRNRQAENPDDALSPRTALQAAVENSDPDMIDFLLSVGADVNAPAAKDSGVTALQAAASTGQVGIARRLMELGADVNAGRAKRNGRTALEAASERGRLDMVQFLLESGADTSGNGARSYDRSLRLASKNGYGAVVGLLREWKRREWKKEEGYQSDGRTSSSAYFTSEDEDDEDWNSSNSVEED